MVLSEIDPALSGIVFGKNPSSYQAEGMGIRSGVPLTQQKQLDLYIELRGKMLESDQIVYAKVLRQTGGPVDVFEARYPHINFSELKF